MLPRPLTRLILACGVTALVGCASDTTEPGGNGNENPTLAITLSSSTLSVPQGASGSTTVTAVRGGGFTGAVTVTVTGAPTGVVAAPTPATIAAGSTNAPLSIDVGGSVAAGSYTLTVRASGSGVTEASATLTLTVTATTQGDYTLSINPGTLSLQTGTQGSATVSLTRSGGFTGSVALTVNGAPTGMTASLDPANTTANTSTLTVSVGANLAAGDYTLTVTGSATGIAAKSVTLTINVTTASAGGDLTWQFCPASGLPVWFAVRDGSGQWTRVTGVNGAYTFSISAATGGVAYVTADGTANELSVFYGTRQELAISLSAQDCNDSPTGKTVTGSVANVAVTDLAWITLGNVTQFVSPTLGSGFTMTGVTDGNIDLVAGLVAQNFTGTGIALTMTKGIIRRNLNPPNGSALTVLDFNSAEAFAPVQSNLTINNLGADASFISNSFVTANGTTGTLYAETIPAGGGGRQFWGVPAAQRVSGDLHMLFVNAVAGTAASATSRGLITMFSDPADRTITLGPAIGPVAVSIASNSPYPRPRAVYTLQPEMNKLLIFAGSQASFSFVMMATGAYIGSSGTFDETLPDFSPVAGWSNTWAPVSGSELTWSFIGNGWSLPGGGAFWPFGDGATVINASRLGMITP